MNLSAIAREIYQETLKAVDVSAALSRKLRIQGTSVYIDQDAIDLAPFREIVLIAMGKAAVPMASSLVALLDLSPSKQHQLRGVVVCPVLPLAPDPRLAYFVGDHPLPGENSFVAASAVLHALQQATEHSLVFFLISGGASAMSEMPLDPSLALSDLRLFHQALVHSGLSITEMNMLRKHISAVKGGRLAVAAGAATMCTLLISDVPPTLPDVIGSGPSLPDNSTIADCAQLLRTKFADSDIPSPIRSWFLDPRCPETPKADHPTFRRANWQMLLSSDDLCVAARVAALARGLHVEVDLACDEWDYRTAADYLLSRARQLAEGPRPACLISAGEVSVSITGHPGIGGRNQQLALHCAAELARWPIEAAVLSAGSDGIDGNSPAAGAVVDTTTAPRAARKGMSVPEALASFNAHPLLHALGDDLVTGPSGNNLRDLRLFLVR